MRGNAETKRSVEEMVANLLDLDKYCAHEYGYSLDQVSIKKAKNGWYFVVKAIGAKKAWVAFVLCDTYEASLNVGTEFVLEGLLDFQLDEWPSRTARRVLALGSP